MPILYRYIITTTLRLELGLFSGFALLLVGQQVIGILQNLPNIELLQLATVMLLILPDAVNDISPIALVLAVLLAGNQLYSQSEIFILKTAGWSPIKVASPFLFVALVTGLIMTVNGSFLKPKAELKLAEVIYDVTNKNFTSYLIPGEFRYLPGIGLTLSASDNRNGTLEDVFIHQASSNQVITGKRAFIQNNGPYDYSLIVEDGSVLQQTPPNTALAQFASYSIQLVKTPFKAKESVEYYDSFQLRLVEGDFPQAELQWRLSRFWYCVFLTAIALLFIPKSPRAGTSLALFTGILMFFIYNDIANDFYSDAARGRVDATWVFWWLYPGLYIGVLLLLGAYRGVRRVI